jgi:cytochrome b6-f complex iron-sulfur subunit
MACETCVNRRDFLARTALAAAALVVADACGDGQIGPTAVPLGSGTTIALSDFPGLATVGTLVDVGHERAVIRTSATTFVALSKICTHQGCETSVTNNRFECPCHLSVFASDGTVVRGPTTGEHIEPLPKLAVTIDQAAGTLTIA